MGTLTLPYKDFITYSKDDFLFRKMLVFNFRFFLLNVLIWSICMIGIKIRTVLNLEFNGLHENVQDFDSRCPGSREITKTYVAKVLWDTLYWLNYLFTNIFVVKMGIIPRVKWIYCKCE